MQKVHLSTFVKASPRVLWDVMLSDATYREWTSVFAPGSYYQGNWEKGSKMLFLGPEKDGAGEMGMVSRIQENRPYEFMSIEHLGMVKDGVEDISSEGTKGWAGAHENYTFHEKDGGTELSVDMDIVDEQKAFMEEAWKKALERLKILAEK